MLRYRQVVSSCQQANRQFHSVLSLRQLSSAPSSIDSTTIANTPLSATSAVSNQVPLFFNNPRNKSNLGTSFSGSSSSSAFALRNDPFTNSQSLVASKMTEQRDIMQLWSLLEACLQTNNFPRSFSILKSLYEIKSHRKQNFIEDYNLYLDARAQNMTNIRQLEKLLEDDLTLFFPLVNYNDKSLAILIHHAIRLVPDLDKLRSHIKTYFKMGNDNYKGIVSYLDILTVSDYKRLYFELKMISDKDIPYSIREVAITVDSNENVVPESLNNSSLLATSSDATGKTLFDEEIKSLSKDVTQLRDVDTIGMKVVKHTLLGLTLNDVQRDQLSNFITPEMQTTTDQSANIDFYQIYKQLKTSKQKQDFELMLNEFNQERQRALELRATDAAKERWKHDFEEAKARGDISIQKSLNAKLWEWYTDMLPLVKEEIAHVHDKQLLKNTDFANYLKLVNPEKMCVITILELLKLNSTGGIMEGMRTARAVISVGKAIEMEFRSEQLLKTESRIFKEVNKKSNEFKKYIRNAKNAFRSMKIERSKIVWPQAVRARIGSVLISKLIKVAKVRVEGTDPVTKEVIVGKAPAFSHSYQYHNGVKLGIIKIHKSLVNQLNGERLAASVQPQLLPMLVKPRAWRNWKSGGYFYSQSLLVRAKDCPEQLAYLEAASNSNAIDKVYDGLNVLGNTAWTVNRKVFDVVSQVWNSGKDFLDIPGIQDKVELIPRPANSADPGEINLWKQRNREMVNKYSANRSMRCDSNYKLEIARAFLGEKFYFPHNLDFRGRAYPLSPHFNHLGNDMSRGLLVFWKGKRLGPEGLKWLKIHLSNLFGVDKVPLDERVAFTESNLDKIRDSAEHPLDGEGWWKQADEPWQALATCFELNEALKLETPEDYFSHQPVHQDGTCNGLQHYAALGGDIEGAQQVNLLPGPKPNDVYLHVANVVKRRLQKILETKDDPVAKFFVEKLNRKIVKQTVMTHVYGVTMVGATLQIDKQIGSYFENKKDSLFYSQYLAKHVFAAIKESFHGAHLIQNWLGECCKRISKSVRLDVDQNSFKNGNKPDFMTSIIWTTPLGLPIVQPYREIQKKQVQTNLQTVYISDPFAVNQINARRQKAGFPPNFIHSLDASHMLLSASKCAEDGLDFASVHDSYWTHACDVEIMSKNLREQFIKLHEVDLIERLKEEFDERYKNYVQVVKVPRSNPIVQEILTLREELSQKLGRPAKLSDEIYMERTRQRLLNSEDPEKVEEGKTMTTTISVTMGNEEALENLDNLSSRNNGGANIFVPLRLPAIPPKDNFDVHDVKDSIYFFS
ncbi:DNA-directed RNA polymerase, mitochondrial [Monosporozyma unispora]|nr:DNA-directed RNA polymerase [Kazachstania unispora]